MVNKNRWLSTLHIMAVFLVQNVATATYRYHGLIALHPIGLMANGLMISSNFRLNKNLSNRLLVLKNKQSQRPNLGPKMR